MSFIFILYSPLCGNKSVVVVHKFFVLNTNMCTMLPQGKVLALEDLRIKIIFHTRTRKRLTGKRADAFHYVFVPEIH